MDPSLQFCLFDCLGTTKTQVNVYDFFIRYLHRASIYLFHDIETINTSKQFKIDLIDNIVILNNHFGYNFLFKTDLQKPTIQNIYSYVCQKIDSKFYANALQIQKGNYYEYNIMNFKIQFFQPYLNYSKIRSWYLTDSPIAILCINLTILDDYKILSYFNLEIDLLIASGFSVVLCVIADLESDMTSLFLPNVLKNHHFSEIHFNLKHKNYEDFDMRIEKFFQFITNYLNNSGYFYLYTKFFNKNIFNLKKYRKETNFLKVFFFSDDIGCYDINKNFYL